MPRKPMSSSRRTPDKDDENSYELGDLELAPPAPAARASRRTEPAIRAQRPLVPAHAALPPTTWGSMFCSAATRSREPRQAGVAARRTARGRSSSTTATAVPSWSWTPSRQKPEPVRAPACRAPVATPERLHSSGRPSASRARGRPLDEERRARELADYGQAEGGLDPARYLIHVGLRMFALRARGPIEQRASELADVLRGGAARARPRAARRSRRCARTTACASACCWCRPARASWTRRRRTAAGAWRARPARRWSGAQAGELKLDAARRSEQAEQRPKPRAKADAELKRQRPSYSAPRSSCARCPRRRAAPGRRSRRIDGERAAAAARARRPAGAVLIEATAALGRARRELALRRGGLDELERKRACKRAPCARTCAVTRRASGTRRARPERGVGAPGRGRRCCGLAHCAREQVLRLRASESALDEVVDQLAVRPRAAHLRSRRGLTGAAMWLGVLFAGLARLPTLTVVRTAIAV